MAVKARCPNSECRQSYLVPEEKLGKQGRCKKCGTRFTLESIDKTKTPAGQTEEQSSRPVPVEIPLCDLKKLGRFEIKDRLGAGAFGEVFRAHDPQLDRQVALKVPRAAVLRNPKVAKRFLIEARATARLTHPNIVPVFDSGKESGHHYIASAFIEGKTLDDAMKDAFDYRETATIVMKLANALAYAHEQGIIHRDIKPANIMLDKEGEPHLMDFGLAQLDAGTENLTHDGAILGTPSYMSPEQAAGDVENVSAASDQYSLGVTLYEMLCGEQPFSGPPEIVIFNAINQEPSAPSSIKSDIPRDLETICLKAMAKEPDKRYGGEERGEALVDELKQTKHNVGCRRLAEDLQRWLDYQPIKARRTSVVERMMRWCRRKPALAATSGVAVALALIAVVGFLVSLAAKEGEAVAVVGQKKAQEEAARAIKKKWDAEQKAAQDRAVAEAQKAASRDVQYAADMKATYKAFEGGQTGRARELLLRHLPKDGQDDVRGFEWFYLWRICQDTSAASDADPATVTFNDQTIRNACLSPDGKMIAAIVATADNDSSTQLVLWDIAKGEVSRTLSNDVETSYDLSFSNDGQWLAACIAGDTIKLWNLTKQSAPISLIGHSKHVGTVAFSPDGSLLATGGRLDGEIRFWALPSGRPNGSIEAHSGGIARTVGDLAFLPDGKRLASGGRDGTVKLWDVKSRKNIRILQHTEKTGPSLFGVVSVAINQQGTLLASGDGEGVVKLWDLRTGDERNVLRNHVIEHAVESMITSLAFMPDGMRLLSVGSDNSMRIWHTTNGFELLQLPGHNISSLDTNGQRLATLALDEKSIRLLQTANSLDVEQYLAAKKKEEERRIAEENASPFDVLGMSKAEAEEALAMLEKSNAAKQEGQLGDARKFLAAATTAWRNLYDKHPDEAVCQKYLAAVLDVNGHNALADGHMNVAEKYWRESVSLIEKMDNPDSALRKSLFLNLATVIKQQGRLEEADKFLLLAMDKAKGAITFNPVEEAKLLNNRGNVLRRQGKYDEAEKSLLEALRIRESLIRDIDPKNADLQNQLAGTLTNLTTLMFKTGNMNRARQFIDRAIVHHITAVRLNPADPVSRRFLRNHYGVRTDFYLATSIRMAPKAILGFASVDPNNAADKLLAVQMIERGFTVLGASKNKFSEATLDNIQTQYKDVTDKVLSTELNRKFAEADALSNLARYLALRPNYQFCKYDVSELIRFAQQGIASDANDSRYQMNLALVNFRAMRIAEANDAPPNEISTYFETMTRAGRKSIELFGGAEAAYFFLMPVIDWKLGKKEEAKTAYEKAVGIMEQNEPDNEELHLLRAEVGALMGIKKTDGGQSAGTR